MNKRDRILTGIAASPGIGIGRAFVFDKGESIVQERSVTEAEVEREIARFQQAISQALLDIIALQERIAVDAGEDTAHIFRAHRAVLEDPEVVDVTIVRIRREQKNAEFIFDDIMQGWIANMSAIANPFFRERTADFEDVRYRVLAKLKGDARRLLDEVVEPVVLVAHTLSPSDTAEMDPARVCGFVTDVGGQTSHTAIVARGLAVPAVVGANIATRQIKDGDLLIIDGNAGLIYVDPDPATVRMFEETRVQLSVLEQELLKLLDFPATTTDGHTVELSANIEQPDEVETVLSHGADSIGLYRTEFLYLRRLPTEEEQYQAYLSIAKQMAPKPVIIRTLDLGMDKMPSNGMMEPEANPALGFRGIRICLERPDIFMVQLRAILRASVVGNLRIMFPMISRITELRASREVLEEVKLDLDDEGIPYDRSLSIGVMVEVPSAALMAHELAREADFFSIGTNDLIQYTLAADRGNSIVASIYDAYDPAVLRLIASVVRAAHAQGIWVGVCGAMAGDPLTAGLLLGLGLDELSMSPIDIPEVKRTIRSSSFTKLQEMAEHVLTLLTSDEIHHYIQSKLTA